MSGPLGNQLRLGKHQDSRVNKTNCFPRDLRTRPRYLPPFIRHPFFLMSTCLYYQAFVISFFILLGCSQP